MGQFGLSVTRVPSQHFAVLPDPTNEKRPKEVLLMPSLTETRTTWTPVSVVSYCLAAIFICTGLAKLWGAQLVGAQFAAWHYPFGLMYVVGGIEIVGGCLLMMPSARAIGAVLLAVIMIGAGVTHFFAQQWMLIAIPTLIFALLVWIGLRSPISFVSPAEPGTPTLHTDEGPQEVR